MESVEKTNVKHNRTANYYLRFHALRFVSL